MVMAHLQRAGHRAIALVGGGTAMIGDPTDKVASRRIMSVEEIDANAEVCRRQLSRYVDLSGGRGMMVNNAEWLRSLNYLEFLRDYGRHFVVNEMARAETYRTRLEAGLTLLEFNYMPMQAYDFLELFRRHNCTLQVGGSDQWANVVGGVDLIRRIERAKTFALTHPLIENAEGQKMGKTAGGETVWLSAEKMSPYDFYQYWINADDAMVARYLAVFTFLPMDEIRDLTASGGADLRHAKERLAIEATTLAHGEEAAQSAREASRTLFGAVFAEELAGSDAVPTTEVPAAQLEAGIPAADLLAMAGLADSKSAARRLIDQGGAYINGERLVARSVTAADLRGEMILLRAGKKRYHRVVPR
jgi:tyrosyl-tRNA synthetase